jgi:protein SCO1/2
MRCVNVVPVAFLVLLSAGGFAAVDEETADPAHPSDAPAAAMMHEGHDHEAMEEQARHETEVGVDERLGDKIPMDVVFVDARGQQLAIGEAITKPTLVLPVFFSCAVTCPIMLANLAQAINDVPLEMGKDYDVVAFSFDETDEPALALTAKGNFTKILEEDLPREEWKFLTGDKESIHSLTGAMGFNFKRTGEHMFIHPNVLIALAPDGTIIRYLYGPRFLPFDIGMALTEAAKGTPGLSIRKLLTYCFDYDPESRSYIVRSFRFLALGIVVLLGIFFVFLVRRKPSGSGGGRG